LNPHYFTSLFKQSMGMNAYQYVITRRIETAKRLLQQQDLPIIQVAHCTGFRSSSHFSNTFRKHIGVTPSGYRKAIK
ncbi:MAG: helix-turn-helix transcriptional regulator, partial [Waterburya sp.]